MRVLVDTYILLRSAQPNHPLCYQATHAVSKLLRQEDSVFFCPQNIAEFRNVATRPADRNGLGFSHEEAVSTARRSRKGKSKGKGQRVKVKGRTFKNPCSKKQEITVWQCRGARKPA
jgi:hypothetical protein